MNKLKVGVIGTGHLGKLHVKMFKHIKNCELVGVYDKNFIQSKAAASEYKLALSPVDVIAITLSLILFYKMKGFLHLLVRKRNKVPFTRLRCCGD